MGKCLTSIRCWDLNTRPFEHEYSPITTRPVVDVIKLFGGHLEFPKIKKLKKFVLVSEPALKCEKQ